MLSLIDRWFISFYAGNFFPRIFSILSSVKTSSPKLSCIRRRWPSHHRSRWLFSPGNLINHLKITKRLLTSKNWICCNFSSSVALYKVLPLSEPQLQWDAHSAKWMSKIFFAHSMFMFVFHVMFHVMFNVHVLTHTSW